MGFCVGHSSSSKGMRLPRRCAPRNDRVGAEARMGMREEMATHFRLRRNQGRLCFADRNDEVGLEARTGNDG